MRILQKVCLTICLVSLLSQPLSFAEDGTSNDVQPNVFKENSVADNPTAPQVPQFKKGDKVYLSINSRNVQRIVVYQSPIKQNEYNNKGFSKDDGYPDNLIPYDDKVDVRIWSRSGSNHEVMRINAKRLLDSIAEKIAKNPEDRSLWQREWIGNKTKASVHFTFAGIGRTFRLHSIEVPQSSSLRERPEYSGGHMPTLRLRIAINGVEQNVFTANYKSWSANFPPKESQFTLREGYEESVVMNLKDENTGLYERHLTEFVEVSFADIQKGTVREKIGDFDNKNDAVVLKFSAVK